jgi:hypothetical protein
MLINYLVWLQILIIPDVSVSLVILDIASHPLPSLEVDVADRTKSQFTNN